MRYTFDELLGLADESTMQSLLGGSVFSLLGLLDESAQRPTNMRRLITQLHTPQELLRDPASRAKLLDLLPQDTAILACETLGLDASSPYGQLSALRASRGSAKEARLLEFFGLPVPEPEPDERPPAVLDVSAEYALWDYQRSIVRRAEGSLATEPHRLLLHMPTGSGKTRTAMHLVAQRLASCEPMLAVWLAFNEELCEQAASEFEKAWSRLGNRSMNVVRFWSDYEPDWDDLRDGIVVAGLKKIHDRATRDLGFIARLADRTSLVVIDEAHQAIADTHARVLRTLYTMGPRTALLGLTATPGRTWSDIGEDQLLADFFDRRKIGIEVDAGGNPVEFLVQRGFLARPVFESLTYQGGPEITPEDERAIARSLDIPKSVLDRLADDAKRNLLIVVTAECLARQHKRIILFAATVEHAELIAAVLSARGTAAYSITTNSSGEARRRLINAYRADSDEPMILCNYGVLTTGFDAPQTSAAIIARPTKSLVLYLQMVGRAIRGPAAGGNAEAHIVTVIDQGLPGFGDVGEAFMNWEDVWS